MKNLILPALASIMLLSSPAPALALTPPASTVLDDHPAPPWVTYPECDAAARLYARQRSGTTYVWNIYYIYYYNEYYHGSDFSGLTGCGIID